MTQLAEALKLPFENDVPIDDTYVLLDLLYCSWAQAHSDRVLRMPFESINDKTPPYVEIGWYCSGYTKEEWSKSYYYLVARSTVEQLKVMGWVMGTPKWGYTDEHELRISENGKREILQRWEELGAGFPRAEDWMKRRRWQ